MNEKAFSKMTPNMANSYHTKYDREIKFNLIEAKIKYVLYAKVSIITHIHDITDFESNHKLNLIIK